MRKTSVRCGVDGKVLRQIHEYGRAEGAVAREIEPTHESASGLRELGENGDGQFRKCAQVESRPQLAVEHELAPRMRDLEGVI